MERFIPRWIEEAGFDEATKQIVFEAWWKRIETRGWRSVNMIRTDHGLTIELDQEGKGLWIVTFERYGTSWSNAADTEEEAKETAAGFMLGENRVREENEKRKS